jgi:prepilin-type N-terminal cleavage/methylation domain-containing protein
MKRLQVRHKRQRAFTLLEVLVSLLLVGMLAASIGLALRTGLDASDRIRERTEVHAEARGVLDLLASDLSAAFLSGVNPEETQFTAHSPEVSDRWSPFLSFTTLNYRRSGSPGAQQEARSDALHVEYALRPRPDGTADLMRQERWLTETKPGEAVVVCERVGALQLQYRGKGGTEPNWTAEPDADPPLKVEDESQLSDAPRTARALPRAVEITLLLAPRRDRERDKPRAYKTVIQLGATGVAPFDTEVLPPPAPGSDPGTNPGDGGGTGGPGG